MFTSIDKALVAVLGGVVYALAHFGVMVPEAWVETVQGLIVAATPVLVYVFPNKGAFTSSSPSAMDEYGGMSIRSVMLSILGILVIGSLAACGGSPQDIQRQSVLLGCSAQATAQGLVLGSPERTAFVAACITPVIVEVVVDEINEAAEDGT